MSKKIDRTGERRQMNNGMWAEIVQYTSSKNIIVKFEDGVEVKTQYYPFKNGEVANYKTRMGEKRKMNNGMMAEIVQYTSATDIIIKFEDGTEVKTYYGAFKMGYVKNPNLLITFKDWCIDNNKLLLEEWADTQNPDTFGHKSNKKVNWKCSVCGNVWKAAIANRVINNSGCPRCALRNQTSFPEQAIFYYIKQYFPNTISQYKYDGKFSFDIYLPDNKIAIEYDGARWHDDKARDENKNEYCRKNNIQLIRFREKGCMEIDNSQIQIFNVEKRNTVLLETQIKKFGNQILNIDIDVNILRDRFEIEKQYRSQLKEGSLASKFPEVAKYFKPENNGGITADMIPYASNKKYWFEYPCGHKCFQTVWLITGRGSRCGICGKKKAAESQKIKIYGVDKLGNKVFFDSMSEAAEQLKICRRSISHCICGKHKTAGGYVWKKVEE